MDIESLLQLQCGVVAVWQLLAETQRARLRREVRAGRWRLVLPRVVVTHNGPLSAEQRRWAAVLYAGAGAVLSHGSALPEPTPLVHVTVPEYRKVRAQPGLVIHRTRVLPDEHVHHGSPPRTKPARSAVDIGAAAATSAGVRLALARVVQQGLCAPRHLVDVIDVLPCVPQRTLLLETAHDLGGGVRSLPELQFRRVIREARLPEPRLQVKFRLRGGTAYLDADWEEFAVSAEVDGVQHALADRRWGDDDRHNEIAIGGRLLLHFPSWRIREEVARVGDQVTRALRSRGWRG